MNRGFPRRGAPRRAPAQVAVLIAMLLASACNLQATNSRTEPILFQNAPTATASETIPPSTPLPSLTPSHTLLPPPTFEPPTLTPIPSDTPSITPTPTLQLIVPIPGLQGLESPTPSGTPGCVVRKDWKLTYTVQPNDALATIAQRYNTYATTLAQANCLADPNMITVGEVLHVPGTVQPTEQAYDCDWTLLTPMDGTMAIPGSGTLTFDWRGPRAPRNLIRIFAPDGSKFEDVVELRQNEAIDLSNLPEGGTYTWYIYPLDQNFQQIICHEGGPWTFTKQPAPTSTPTSNSPLGGLQGG